jgi:methylmalonyl-CoA mutase
MDTPLPLADTFEPAARAAWLALVEKTLKGAGVETLTTRTPDGAEVAPLYTRQDASPASATAIRPGAGWDIRAEIAAGPGAADAALEALAGGAGSLLVKVRDPGQLASALEGVMTDVAPIALDAGFAGPAAAEALSDIAKAAPAAPLAFHLDPLSAFARDGAAPGPLQSRVDTAAALAPRFADTYPRASLFLASGTVVHEAGGTPAAEIAFAAAAALTYAKALQAVGLSMSEAWQRIVLGLAVDAEPIVGIAKLRAARRVWDRITSACGAPTPAPIEARSSRRMLARSDHWTNLVRLTAAGFAGAVGGADAIVLGSFAEPLGREPDVLAQRQARNIQLVLMEEAKLGAAADPAAGCWALEAQTDALARAAWSRFTDVERQGGLIAALLSGSIAADVGTARAALQAALDDKSRRIVGVTDFRPADAPTDTRGQAPPGAGPPALSPIRLEDLVG